MGVMAIICHKDTPIICICPLIIVLVFSFMLPILTKKKEIIKENIPEGRNTICVGNEIQTAEEKIEKVNIVPAENLQKEPLIKNEVNPF